MEGYYSVKEMTQRLGIEAHILRYWEKELELDIPRDGQGRRIYGEEEVRTLEKVSVYKREGKPLRMIKGLLRAPLSAQEEEEDQEKADRESGRKVIFYRPGKEEKTDDSVQNKDESEGEQKNRRLQQLLYQMVAEAVRESGGEMITEMKESMLKELDYQFRLREEREEELMEQLTRSQEEHFERLDAMFSERTDKRSRFWTRRTHGDVQA